MAAAVMDRLRNALFSEDQAVGEAERAVVFAIFLILVDQLAARGPLRHILLQPFPKASRKEGTKEAKRLAGQVAARFVGCIFLIAMFPFALSVILDPELKADKMYATNAHSSSMVVYAAGYFLYDILLCLLRFNENGPSFLVHAIGCSLAFWYPMFTRHLHYFGACFLMWEISTPFLYFRWFLLKTNRGEKPIMALANNAFALAFLGCRVIFGPIMSYDFWQSTSHELASMPRPGAIDHRVIIAYRAANVILNGLNYFWFSQIISAAFSKDRSTRRKVE